MTDLRVDVASARALTREISLSRLPARRRCNHELSGATSPRAAARRLQPQWRARDDGDAGFSASLIVRAELRLGADGVTAYALNGSTRSGPSLHARAGDVLRVRFRNLLAGEHIDARRAACTSTAPLASDAHHARPTSASAPYASARVARAGSHWLPTAHARGRTGGRRRRHGSSSSTRRARCPPSWRRRKTRLVIQQLARGGSAPSLLLLNGQLEPRIRVRAGAWQRWRLLHAGSIGQLDVTSDGGKCEFQLLAKDGVYIADFPERSYRRLAYRRVAAPSHAPAALAAQSWATRRRSPPSTSTARRQRRCTISRQRRRRRRPTSRTSASPSPTWCETKFGGCGPRTCINGKHGGDGGDVALHTSVAGKVGAPLRILDRDERPFAPLSPAPRALPALWTMRVVQGARLPQGRRLARHAGR